MGFLEVAIIAIYAVQIITAIFLIFFEKKNPSVTLTWLLIITVFPIGGYILYFLFGTTLKLKLDAKHKRIDSIEEKYLSFIHEQFNIMKNPNRKSTASMLGEYRNLITLNTKNSMSYYTENNSVEVFTSAKEKYARLFAEIENAKVSINIVYFIINAKDNTGKTFIDLLAKKAKEGVKVRLVYDRFGQMKNRKKDFAKIIEAGGEVVPYMPSFLKTVMQANYRMHRKMVIIDGIIGYTGGINIGDEYLGKNAKITPWRDTSIRITGPSVNAMQLRFITDYIFLKSHYRKAEIDDYHIDVAKEMFPVPLKEGNAGVQIVSSGPDSEHDYVKDGYIKMINLAKKYVYIQTPYFIPDDTFLNAVRIAALSGIDVRIMIPKIPDKKFVYYITLSYVQELLSWGVKVYLYDGFIHAKTLVVDDKVVSIGSTNVDMRSFSLNYELNAFIYGEKEALESKEIFKKDMHKATKVTLEEFKKRFVGTKVMECVCRIIAPLA